MNRRGFLSRLAAAGVLTALSPRELLGSAGSREEGLFIGHLAPAGSQLGGVGAAAARGAQLAGIEAAQAAMRLRRRVRLLEATATGAAESLAAAARLVERGATVLLGGFGRETAAALDELAAEQGVLFLNVGHGGDELRDRCRPTTFHVEASSAMRRDALERWVDEGGDREVGAVVVGWSASLEHHGAAQLNDRYRLRFNEVMSSASWSSWMAVKLAWDAFARTRGGDAMTMARFLASERTSFDGRKGIALSFRPWDHQLRQPLYIVRHAAEGDLDVLAEVPHPAAAAPGGPSALLDTIGGERRSGRCIDGG